MKELPHLASESGITLDTTELSKIFNIFFCTVFVQENDFAFRNSSLQMETCMPAVFIHTDVANPIDKLPSCSSSGPGNITVKLLKSTRSYSALIHSFIFQRSFDTGEIPKDWKLAHIIPLLKKGDKN